MVGGDIEDRCWGVCCAWEGLQAWGDGTHVSFTPAMRIHFAS